MPFFILMLEKLHLFNVDHFHNHNFKVIFKNVHKLFSEFLCQLVQFGLELHIAVIHV